MIIVQPVVMAYYTLSSFQKVDIYLWTIHYNCYTMYKSQVLTWMQRNKSELIK